MSVLVDSSLSGHSVTARECQKFRSSCMSESGIPKAFNARSQELECPESLNQNQSSIHMGSSRNEAII